LIQKDETMAELTGLFGVDWATVFFILFGLVLVAMSTRHDVQGVRVGPVLVIPLVSGVLLVTALSIRLADDISRFFPFLARPITAVLTAGAAFVAYAVADLLFTRFAKLPARLWRRDPPPWLGDAGLAVVVGGAALVSGVAMFRLSAATNVEPPATGLGAGFTIETTHALPSAPLDVELRSERDGYISLGTRVVHFDLPEDPGGAITLTTVADGFTYTRGLTIAGDVLVVGDLGPLPCPEPYPVCKGNNVPDVDVIEGERRILEGSRGRLIAFDIELDGSLANERVILDHLPVANTEHGLNGIVTGPDGQIYVAIGNLDRLPADIAEKVDHPKKDLLGTVIRLSPEGDNMEVFARGLRNVYGLTFDDRGNLWGVDNDGETPNGWRAEEILHIRRGRNYGYPYEGSFGEFKVRDDFAVWHAHGTGSAGILWANELRLGPGLLIGSCGWLDGLRLTDMEGDWAVSGRSEYTRLLQVPGCVSDLEPLGDDRVIASVVGADSLYVLAVEH
jgi:hypothetical protein